MPGLKQAGCIAKDRLKAHLNHFGFTPMPRTLALWKHDTKPILLSLVVEEFGVKYIRKENADHLIQALQKLYTYPSTGLVPCSADSPLTGTMTHAPATSPYQSIYKQN